jgi:ClpP class serine protease
MNLTGSIGVFGVKLDATEAAKRHGVNFDSVTAGKHAGTYSLFQPLNHSMKMNLSRNMDRVYMYFKKLVSEGRNMTLEETEDLAQGRVWTGCQAKDINLVDDFGGIHRAIAYATSTYTSGGLVEVEIFPKPKQFPFLGSFDMETASSMDTDCVQQLLIGALDGSVSKFATPCSVVLCMDEATAMQTIIRDACQQACSKQ